MIGFILGVVFTLFGLTSFMAVLGSKAPEASELPDWQTPMSEEPRIYPHRKEDV